MKKGALITLAAVSMAGAGCTDINFVGGHSALGLKGSGKPISRTFDFKEIKGLKAAGPFQVTVTPDSAPLVVTCDDNLMPHLVQKVEGQVVSLGFDRSVLSKLPITASVGIKSLESLELSGAPSLRAQGVESERLRIELSGAAKADLSGSLGKAELTLTGASHLVLDASPEELKMDLSGASSLEAKGRGGIKTFSGDVSGASSATVSGTIEDAQIKLSGASKADLDARVLKGSASGASELKLRTQPEEESFETSGASSVKAAD